MRKKFKFEFHVFGCFFEKCFEEQVLKSFSGRNNSRKPPVFGYCDSPPFSLAESRELRTLIRWVLG